MWDWITPTVFDRGLAVGMLITLFIGLTTGRLATRRELNGKDAEIKFLREQNAEITGQNAKMVETLDKTNAILDSFRAAAEEGK